MCCSVPYVAALQLARCRNCAAGLMLSPAPNSSADCHLLAIPCCPLRQSHSFPLQMSLKEVNQGDTKAYMVRWDGMQQNALHRVHAQLQPSPYLA